jgi:hypothetical protein
LLNCLPGALMAGAAAMWSADPVALGWTAVRAIALCEVPTDGDVVSAIFAGDSAALLKSV